MIILNTIMTGGVEIGVRRVWLASRDPSYHFSNHYNNYQLLIPMYCSPLGAGPLAHTAF